MRPIAVVFLTALLLLAACDGQEETALGNFADGANVAQVQNNVRAEAEADLAPLEPPAPGTPGGLPDDRSLAENKKTDTKSAAAAAQVVEGYFGLLEQKRFADAQDLWGDETVVGDESDVRFAARFRGFSEIHANIGAPDEIEGAAGSLFVTVPVQVYGRLAANGKPWYSLRQVTLRRVNDVPGSTAAQRRWHIQSIGAYVPPTLPEAGNGVEAPAEISATDAMADKR